MNDFCNLINAPADKGSSKHGNLLIRSRKNRKLKKTSINFLTNLLFKRIFLNLD